MTRHQYRNIVVKYIETFGHLDDTNKYASDKMLNLPINFELPILGSYKVDTIAITVYRHVDANNNMHWKTIPHIDEAPILYSKLFLYNFYALDETQMKILLNTLSDTYGELPE